MATPATGIADGNADMAAAWDGPEGDHWADHAEHYEATSPALGRALLAAAGLHARSSVLDIGCGTGASTLDAARQASSGSAHGIDLSARMLARAREKASAAGLDNATFEQADAQVHQFAPGAFDVAISSFGAMFFADPVVAFSNIRRALRPGGSIALLAWRTLDENEWISSIRAALAAGRDLPSPPPGVQGPFSMADRSITTERLGAAGFDEITFTPLDERTCLGRDADDAYSFLSTSGVARGLTQDLDEATRNAAFAALRQTFEDHETADGVTFAAAAWLITARNASVS